MASLLTTPGKYRTRKDLSANSIPTLVSLEEESISVIPYNNSSNGKDNRKLSDSAIATMTTVTTTSNDNGKPPRRSSLGLGLLSGRKNSNNTTNKRRSSIAVAFLGRRNSKSKEPTIEKGQLEKYQRKASESDTENDPPMSQTLPSESDTTLDKKRRRSSWQAKLERRRRKGLPSTAMNGEDLSKVEYNTNGSGYDAYNNRQKRHSWWNIFVPENMKNRSRRASQDAGLIAASVDKFQVPQQYRRSKSRSVDHGLAVPFDLDSLRSKVEGRFESIDRLAKGPAIVVPTVPYTVGDRDTLTSVAARFDTTPSELTQLNKLGSSFIYSGQTLLVPDKTKLKDDDNSSEASGDTESSKDRKGSSDDIPQDEKDLLDDLRPSSPKPGRIERILTPANESGTGDDDPVIIQRFLKINVRHITDGQGVVGGVLLVTPNAVMFDPNVSDPLVIEHGPESYGVIAPMEFIVNAAIFNDIAHMRVGSGEYTTNSTEKPEVYHTKTCNRCDTHSPGKDSLLVKDETFPELGVSGSVDQESNCSNDRDDGDAFPKAFERDLVTPNNLERLHEDSTESAGASDVKKPDDEHSLQTKSTLEERRKSLLDQHWAIPSKDRSEEDEEEDGFTQRKVTASLDDDKKLEKEVRCEGLVADNNNENSLVRTSCHDSGIDIRESMPIPTVPIIPTKKVYSDADIVLSSDWVPPLTIAPACISTETRNQNATSLHNQDTISTSSSEQTGGRKKTSSVSFSVEENEGQVPEKVTGEVKKSKMLKRLSYPLSWVEGLTGDGSTASGDSSKSDSAPNTSDSNQSVFSKVFSSSPITLVSEFGGNLFLSKTPSEESGGSPVPPLTPHDTQNFSSSGRSSIGTFIRSHPSTDSSTSSQSGKPVKQPPPKLDYRSMVSIDDMPALFVSFDMKAPLFPQLENLELIPRPARACADPPMYLRLRMGRQVGKSTPLPTTVMSYGKNKLRPEYWFSIPKNKVDELYRFLNSWVAHLYGDLDEDALKNRGFELVQHDTEWANNRTSSKDGGSLGSDEIGEYTRESWELLKAPFVKTFNIIKSQTGSNDLEGLEVLSMSKDDYRNATFISSGSFDQDFPIPELIGQTEILSEDHREKLCGHLPARAEGYSWSLVFSTSQHGFSLNSLYRKMHKLESPILIVIEDTEKNVFGALTSCSLHVSDHFYGTGESLLYKFNPNFKVFHWSGENLYFIKGNPESLAIGAGDGKFGLWLDGDLNQGRSQSCSTYSNEPLAPEEDFVIKTLECWAFV